MVSVKIDADYPKGKPNTEAWELYMIGDGRAVEGYTLRYLRQIRDLLIDIKEGLKSE